MSSPREFILTLSCRDTKGIVYAVSGLLYQAGCNILESQQFGDVLSSDATGLFFMRVHFEAPEGLTDPAALEALVAPLRTRFSMELLVHPLARKPRLRPSPSWPSSSAPSVCRASRSAEPRVFWP